MSSKQSTVCTNIDRHINSPGQCTLTNLKYADDTCVIGLVGNDLDLCNYISEINRSFKQCMDLHLLLDASQTKEMLFSTQRLNVILDGTEYHFVKR